MSQWAETHKQCNRMRLSDMLARPHQRITKYPLMLKSILKRTEVSATRDSLVSMVSSVESFLHHINSLLQHKEELQKLSVAAGRIEGYEVLESASEEVDKVTVCVCVRVLYVCLCFYNKADIVNTQYKL
ncbi:UNVERIFIED_CONTAM: hypothetical protein FKN15_019568 [Acipenser sinensis]